jgi:TonB family protein
MMLLGTSLLLVLFTAGAQASGHAPQTPSPPRQDLGKWWKNSEIVRELQLSEAQVNRIEQTFLEHRLKLIDLRAELERQETRLQPLIEVDQPDEAKVGAQIDLVLAARGRLEKANTMMMLAIRRVLSVDQWKKLQAIQEQRARDEREWRGGTPTQPPLAVPPQSPHPPGAAADFKDPREAVYAIRGGVRPPVPLHQPLPPYTQDARNARVEGLVLLQGIIRKDGSADSFKIVRGLGYGLDESAINTISGQWRFKPGTLDGKPVDVQANIEISFRLPPDVP